MTPLKVFVKLLTFWLAFLPGLIIGLALYVWLTWRNPAVAEWFRGSRP